MPRRCSFFRREEASFQQVPSSESVPAHRPLGRTGIESACDVLDNRYTNKPSLLTDTLVHRYLPGNKSDTVFEIRFVAEGALG